MRARTDIGELVGAAVAERMTITRFGLEHAPETVVLTDLIRLTEGVGDANELAIRYAKKMHPVGGEISKTPFALRLQYGSPLLIEIAAVGVPPLVVLAMFVKAAKLADAFFERWRGIEESLTAIQKSRLERQETKNTMKRLRLADAEADLEERSEDPKALYAMLGRLREHGFANDTDDLVAALAIGGVLTDRYDREPHTDRELDNPFGGTDIPSDPRSSSIPVSEAPRRLRKLEAYLHLPQEGREIYIFDQPRGDVDTNGSTLL